VAPTSVCDRVQSPASPKKPGFLRRPIRSQQPKFRSLLDRHGITFDERYVWE
jgi:hypothetical protein